MQFPYCYDANAISVACLDLHYYVTINARAHIKDENMDTHSPLTLKYLQPETELDGINSVGKTTPKALSH